MSDEVTAHLREKLSEQTARADALAAEVQMLRERSPVATLEPCAASKAIADRVGAMLSLEFLVRQRLGMLTEPIDDVVKACADRWKR